MSDKNRIVRVHEHADIAIQRLKKTNNVRTRNEFVNKAIFEKIEREDNKEILNNVDQEWKNYKSFYELQHKITSFHEFCNLLIEHAEISIKNTHTFYCKKCNAEYVTRGVDWLLKDKNVSKVNDL